MPIKLARCALHIFTLLVLVPPILYAQDAAPAKRKFDPPRIIEILRTKDKGTEGQDKGLLYFVNKGQEVSINRGDVLNVYREKRIHPSLPRTMRIFIGTLTVTESQNGSSMGTFAASAKMNLPIIKYKVPMKTDIVVPRLIIDSGVLFNPGDASLNTGVAAEFQKVADFIQNFSPNKIIIEGHTDSDGDEDPNQLLSDQRSEAVVQFLVNTYPFITTGMIESRGYGETQPIAPNDTPENKKLNRRIEVVIWE
jgi:outer membrane protein OmpA-like peptidoglycan-associated protein